MPKILKPAIFCFVFIILFQLLIMRVSPTYIADDSPETVLSMFTLGIQHPPGYALNSLIGKIFLLIPVGNIMLRSSIMSVFFHLLTVLILFWIVIHIFKKDKDKNTKYYIATLASTFYLFSNTTIIESYSAKGSIYSLQSLLTAIIFISIFKTKENIKWLYLAFFILGISIGNHTQSTLVIIPTVLIALYLNKISLKKQNIMSALFFLIVGITIITYLFIRSTSHPVLFWGEIKDLKDLIWLLSRAQYASVENIHTITDTLNLVKFYFLNILPGEYPYLIAFLFIPGLIILLKEKRYYGLVFLSSIVFMLGGVFFISTPKLGMEWLIKPYLTFSYIFISILIAYTIFYIINFIKNVQNRKVLGIIISGLLFTILLVNSPNYSKYFQAYDYSNNVYLSLPQESIYFAEGDINVNGALYNTYVNNKRINVVNVQLLEQIWYQDQIRSSINGLVLNTNRDLNFRDYLKNVMNDNANKGIYYSNALTKNLLWFDLAPRGIVNEVIIGKSKMIYDPYFFYKFYSYRGIFDNTQKIDDATRMFINEAYGKGLVKIAKMYNEKNDFENTSLFYRRSFMFYKNDMIAINIARYYAQRGNEKEAEFFLNEALKINNKCIQALEGLSMFAMKNGDNLTARKYLQTIVKYDPSNEVAKSYLNRISGNYK